MPFGIFQKKKEGRRGEKEEEGKGERREDAFSKGSLQVWDSLLHIDYFKETKSVNSLF